MSDEKEGFSWVKYAKGIFNPLNFAKYSSFFIQMALVTILIFGCAKAGVALKNWLFPKPTAPVTIENTTGGHIETQPDKRQKIGVINF